MLATYAMARGWIEFWLGWIAVDLVGVPLLLHFRLLPVGGHVRVYGVLRHLGLLRLAQDLARGADRRADPADRRPWRAGPRACRAGRPDAVA